MDEKSKCSSSDDRLSELPDSLIFDIFWFLPITDVIRTTTLSRRWRDLWTTSPSLNFTDYDLDDYPVAGTKVGHIFNRALIFWRGARILKFKVAFNNELSAPLVGDVNVWLRFAKEKQVNELFLDLIYPVPEDYLVVDLPTLFSCSSLEVLSIKDYCYLEGAIGSVKWDRLKSLTIYINNLKQDMLSKVLCGSPKLEEFTLDYYVDEEGEWCIRSTSLKKLRINKISEHQWYPDYYEDTEMMIEAPNLETLQIEGVPYTNFSMDVVPLTDLTLKLYCTKETCNCGELESDEFPDTKDMLEQIFPTIQHVERLTLRECCLQVLGAMTKKSLLSPFPNVELLKFNIFCHTGSFSKHLQIAGLLQNFPKLKRLVIDDEYKYKLLVEDENEDAYQDDGESREFEASLPNTFLLQLRTVEVTWNKCDGTIFLFIKTLLKYASKLEKLVFQVRGFNPPSSPSDSLFLASQKLLRMPRSSPNAQLIFCKY